MMVLIAGAAVTMRPPGSVATAPDPPGLGRGAEQEIIDAEVRTSRRHILAAFWRRIRGDVRTLASGEFLALADAPTVHAAVMIAARATADACDLRRYDPASRSLRLVRGRRLPAGLLRATTPPHCVVALDTGDPVLVDDVTTCPLFAGHPSLPTMLEAGIRAAHAYPLRRRGAVLGVLSLYHHTSGRHPGQELLAWATAEAVVGTFTVTWPHRAPSTARAPEHGTTAAFATDARTSTLTVAVRSPLDALTAPRLTAHLAHGVADHHTLVLDLRELDFLAVAGVRALLAAAELCAARGVGCSLVLPPDHHARTVLDRLGATRDLPLVGNHGHVTDHQGR
jgi:anti-anti-sigma regulatory factor